MFETQKRVQTNDMLNHVSKMGGLIRKYIDLELGDHEFYLETRGRGLNTAFEYKCINQHGFSLELQRRMMDKHSDFN